MLKEQTKTVSVCFPWQGHEVPVQNIRHGGSVLDNVEQIRQNWDVPVGTVLTTVTATAQAVDTECFLLAIVIRRQIKYHVQQHLAYNNLPEFPLSSQSYLAQPAPLAIKDHKAQDSRQMNNVCL